MIRGAIALALVAVALGGGLTGCGKRGKLVAPKGEESAYTYPHIYPKPDSVVPSGAPGAPGAPESREEPAGAGGIGVFPGTGRTRTYGAPAPR